jgi:hypothetical protein|tara:strand:- start:256 stop:450 length:195 start_codon:yes stop_codon:yes gene_type:complete
MRRRALQLDAQPAARGLAYLIARGVRDAQHVAQLGVALARLVFRVRVRVRVGVRVRVRVRAREN